MYTELLKFKKKCKNLNPRLYLPLSHGILFQHGYTPLYVAVMENRRDVVEELLIHGANKKLGPDVSN